MAPKRELLQEDAGIVNAMRYAANSTAFNAATLAAAIAAQGSTPTTILLPPASWTLGSPIVVPETITLMVPPMPPISLTAGLTLTLSHAILLENPIQQLFTGAGTATFANQSGVKALPQWWGAKGDGATNDKAAINAAFVASRLVHFLEGTYNLGDLAPADIAIDLSALGDGITITTDGRVKLLCNTTATGITFIFYMYNNSNFYCEPIELEDTGGDIDITWRGAWGFYLANPAAAISWGNLYFAGIIGTNLVGGVACTASAPYSYINRIRGITIDEMTLTDCYYGFNCQNDGINVVINRLHGTNIRRIYFVYGVIDHVVNLLVDRPYNSDGNCHISRAVGGLDTRGLDIRMVFQDSIIDGLTPVQFSHIDLLGGVISNVKVHLLTVGMTTAYYYPIRFINYDGAGTPTQAPSLNYVEDIFLSGTCNGSVYPVDVYASYATKRQMHFTPGLNFLPGTTLFDAFQFDQLARAQTTISWETQSGASPSLGNGTLTYDIDIINGMCQVTVHLAFGSTTNGGGGAWSFVDWLPIILATGTAVGSWLALDSGNAFYCGSSRILAGASVISLYMDGSGNGVGPNLPFTWGDGDTLHATICYPIS